MTILPLLLFLSAQAPSIDARSADVDPVAKPRSIEFQNSLPRAKQLAAASGLPIVLVFGAVWCDSCRLFKRATLPTSEVQSLADQFHWVYVEIEREVSLSHAFDVRSSPQIVVIDAEGRHLGTAIGALSAQEFVSFLQSSKQRAESPSAGLGPRPALVRAAEFTPMTWTPDGYRGRAVCFYHVGYGPLSLPSQSPAQVLRIGIRPRTPSTLAKGQYQLSWTESAANVFAFREGDFRLDYLTINSVLGLSYGLSDTLQIGLEYSDVTRTNSALDPLVDSFHDIFGLGDSGREKFDSGDNVIQLSPKNGVSINSDTSGSESRDITLSMQHNLTCGTETMPAISYALDMRFHAGGRAQLRGDNAWSVAASTALAQRIGKEFYTYVGLGYAWHGLDEARGLPLKDNQFSALVALEWHYGAKSSWVLQYLVSEGVALDRDPFDKPSNELNLGWKREISAGTVLEIGLIENIIEVDNSPDFGLHFGLQYRF